MMKVGVQLNDADFAQALVRGLAVEGRNACFFLVEDTSEDMFFDLIMTDGDTGDHRTIQLVESADEEMIYDGPPYRIFRYQHARDLFRNLLYILHRETGRSLEFAGDVRCKTLAFVSLSGELDSTALALTTGEILYQHFGYRCLYINLCPIDGSKCFLPGKASKSFLTMLYYLSQEKDFPLLSFIRQHFHVDYIDTSISNPYFDEMDSIRLHHLLKKIDDLGKYTYLILDLGNHLSRHNKSLLARAEEMVVVVGDGRQLPKVFFDELMHLLEGLSTDAKIRKVSLEGQKSETTDAKTAFLENGLLDLSAMKYIRWEADRLVKDMMEQRND